MPMHYRLQENMTILYHSIKTLINVIGISGTLDGFGRALKEIVLFKILFFRFVSAYHFVYLSFTFCWFYSF